MNREEFLEYEIKSLERIIEEFQKLEDNASLKHVPKGYLKDIGLFERKMQINFELINI